MQAQNNSMVASQQEMVHNPVELNGNTGFSAPMRQRVITEQGERLLRLQDAVGAVNISDMARRLGMSQQRWANYINGRPLTREAVQIVSQKYPGIAWEWLWAGNQERLSDEWRGRLYPPAGRTKRTTGVSTGSGRSSRTSRP